MDAQRKTHREVIAIEREEDQTVSLTIGSTPTGGGREIPGGFDQMFRRVVAWRLYAKLPDAAKLIYPALVHLADNRDHFLIKDVGYATICDVAGVSRNTARRGIKVLVERRLLAVIRQGYRKPDGSIECSTYQMLVPTEQPALGSDRDHPYIPKGHTPVSFSDLPLGSQMPRDSGALGHNRMAREGRFTEVEEIEQVDSSRSAVADEFADELRKRGIGEPLLSRIIDSCDQQTIERHLVDFDIRNKLPGPKKTAGWLVKAITVPYELHEKTHQHFSLLVRKAKAEDQHRRQRAADQSEAEQTASIERWVEGQFDGLDDDELDAWKRKAIQQYGTLARGLDKADPRENERLRRLIKGMLAHLCPMRSC